MKTINMIFKRAIVLCCLACGVLLTANAQWDIRNLNLVIDWQVNAPFSTGFADKISGWGMNYELKYKVAPRWDVGVFASFHSNHQYVDRMFARNTTYYGINGLYDKAWGGYVSPEIGFNIYPCKTKNWGFHVAGYYSYGTNKTYTLTDEINGQNNAGFRVGVIF